MQFSIFALSALSIGSALAKSSSTASTSGVAAAAATGSVTVHVVRVGSANGTLAYFPNNLVAAKGDMVQFQFAPANHTVTQSTFDQPCQPISLHTNITGFYSGFMPVAATSTTTPTYTIMVNSTTPMWIYCSQGKHCQNGMTMVINENVAANATRSLANYQALAKLSTVNLPGNTISGQSGGAASNSTTNSGNNSGNSGSSGSSSTTTSVTDAGSEPTATGTGTGAGASGTAASSSATSGSGSAKATGAASSVSVSSSLGLGGALAMVMAFLL